MLVAVASIRNCTYYLDAVVGVCVRNVDKTQRDDTVIIVRRAIIVIRGKTSHTEKPVKVGLHYLLNQSHTLIN